MLDIYLLERRIKDRRADKEIEHIIYEKKLFRIYEPVIKCTEFY